jgi:sec-independent protein translocase protein TatB
VFGIGWTEFIVIALILLVFVGPKHLPGLLRKLGRITAELRSASRELRNQISVEVEDFESPSQLVRDAGREALDRVNQEYAGVREADAELRRELEQLADPYADAADAEPDEAELESSKVAPPPADKKAGEP